MKFFIDSAEVAEIKKAAQSGIIDGVTTNPSLIKKSGRKFEEVVKEIAAIVDGPISAEVVSLTAEEMIKEAQTLLKIHKNVIIKLPMTEEGIRACSQLSQQGVKTNVTLVFHVNQALLAAKAGASFVSPFAGRLDDIGYDGMDLIEEIVGVFKTYGFKTQVLAASIRNPEHVRRAAIAHADVCTMPPEVFHKLFYHYLTDQGIEKFLKDWDDVRK
ncbi:MAG: fructose-6-phosphate aldolase [Candidatus Kerfeldbacteria bacterium RIFOXYA2_FULL_38_24]|uniref:Probable transaldolase n=1 Tax=Candidatus Kerfeldbacteria bacterium RIFOXYB2_FULL_38_14 TaxID=1798547 RepID=A0A1G2BGU6_9BACT|nr:MAG: fructose-6-phosphate aldolase [Candidatus Kerfeldbacteria bacterium RIFOXYA2_FULL_38_24]OGY88394.1 MAG: fructose-6-phosphate aldolase [Candidatus Kerfeldbacteria bacterium RIFOXYB2_FULL_38_14]OGY89085.1 MAG: fructose-6-phosphate aldolase [Candidatus Kerfeldbacteria bacterium RIFOXYC2_FULL_38_9]